MKSPKNRINSDLMVHLSFDDFQILHASNMKYFDGFMMQFYLQGLNLIHLVMVYNNSLGVSMHLQIFGVATEDQRKLAGL